MAFGNFGWVSWVSLGSRVCTCLSGQEVIERFEITRSMAVMVVADL